MPGLLNEVHTESNVITAMRDGVLLASDVYRPAEAGAPIDAAFPVLLQRTPYSKTRPDLVQEAMFSPPTAMSRWCKTAGHVTNPRASSPSTSMRARTGSIHWLGWRSSPGTVARSAPMVCPTRRTLKRRRRA